MQMNFAEERSCSRTRWWICCVRQLMNDADRMTRYFAAMKEALYEAGEQVEGTSRAVLERLEDSEAELNRLLQ